MKLIDIILGFFKSLFKKPTNNGDCEDCTDVDCDECQWHKGDIVQTTDKGKKYVVIVGMENSRYGGCPGADKDSNTMLSLIK